MLKNLPLGKSYTGKDLCLKVSLHQLFPDIPFNDIKKILRDNLLILDDQQKLTTDFIQALSSLGIRSIKLTINQRLTENNLQSNFLIICKPTDSFLEGAGPAYHCLSYKKINEISAHRGKLISTCEINNSTYLDEEYIANAQDIYDIFSNLGYTSLYFISLAKSTQTSIA